VNATARKKTTVIFAAVVLLGFVVANHLRQRQTPSQQADEIFRKAKLLTVQRKWSAAEKMARQAIALNSNPASAYSLAAECAAAQRNYEQALNDLSHVPNEDNEWLTARRLAADILHNRVYRFREAERAYLDVLSRSPDDVVANSGYAHLLGLCGRRSEAIPHVLRLIRAGQETDLLMLLARESGALNNPEMLEAARQADATDPNPLLGQAQAAASAQDHRLAFQKLQEASLLHDLPYDFHGQLGRQLLANQRFDDLNAWAREISVESVSADSWLVLAELADRAHDQPAAIRCYWEAVKLRPESLQAISRLARKLTSVQQAKQAEPFFLRVRAINELRDRQQLAIMSDQQPGFPQLLEMVEAYESVGRHWEAFAWGRLLLETEPKHTRLFQIVRSIGSKLSTLPLKQTLDEYNPAYDIDLSQYPMPRIESQSTRRAEKSVSNNISFKQQGDEIGFDFQYFDGTKYSTRRMFELGGGGIAVIDFDNDGAPDLLCTQGRPWSESESEPDKHHDRLFRNQRGQSFVDITEFAAMRPDTGFGQGASAQMGRILGNFAKLVKGL
jgi:hypothetical protein